MQEKLTIKTKKEMEALSCTELTEHKLRIEKYLERVTMLTREKALERLPKKNP